MTGQATIEPTALTPVPHHVPPELVCDFDFLTPQIEGDLFTWWARLHDGPDIFFTPRHGGHWVATRHEDLAHIMSAYDYYSSTQMSVPKDLNAFPMPPISYDPPLHTEFRRLLNPYFTPKAIGDLERRARALTISLIDRFIDKRQCEFVSEFALEMPIGIFMQLVDLPSEDRLTLISCAHKIVRGTAEVQAEGYGEAYAYLGAVFAARKTNPGNDILSALIKGRIKDKDSNDERPLTDHELLGAGALLLAGGLDTVAGMMSFIIMHLARNDDHRRYLTANPQFIPGAIEELMRRHQSASVGRMVTRDHVYKGVAMKAGDMILTPTVLAGLDERRYPDPMRVDLDRGDKKSIVFGAGPHICIGQFLARTELRLFVREWLTRIPDFAIAPGEHPVTIPGRSNSVLYLPLVWYE